MGNKKKAMKIFAVVMALTLATPMAIGNHSISVSAAAPKLNVKKKTLSRIGDTYNLVVKNEVKGSKYTWTTSNKKIATVSKYGVVKGVAKGTATIKCKIKLPNKKTKTLACKVTVKNPAKTISISNLKLSGNNTHRIQLGQTYQFKTKISPTKSSDKVYWKVQDEKIATVDSKGNVTPKSVGVTRLTAVAASSEANAEKSKVSAGVILSVVRKMGSIVSVDTSDSMIMKIQFSHPVNPKSVIKNKNQLLENISIIAMKDGDGKSATNYGEIEAVLSENNTLLTITATAPFIGKYNLVTTSGVVTEDGMTIEEFDEIVVYGDNGPPLFKDVTLDDEGTVASINFSEPVDLTKMTIESISRTDNVSLSKTTEKLLATTANYKLSKDRRSVLIDLSGIALSDKDKPIQVAISGIVDLTGNATEPNPVTVYVQTDTSIKPQAEITTVERTAFNEITAYFSRGLKTAGSLTILGYTGDGVIDKDNTKMVRYELSPAIMKLTGVQSLRFANWTSYNVAAGSSNPTKTHSMSMTYPSVAPEISNFDFETKIEYGLEYNILKLTFDKNVTTAPTGNLFAVVTNESGHTVASNNIPYTAVAVENVISITFDNSSMNASGTYKITIPEDFAKDETYQPNKKTEISFDKIKSTVKELPAPTKITQSLTDASVIFVEFGNKVDENSAIYMGNYEIEGATISSVELVSNTTYQATVKLTVVSGTLEEDGTYPIFITGVRGYDNSYSEIVAYKAIIDLKENVPPNVKSVTLTDTTTIVITFDDYIKGNPSFNVFQNSATVNLSTSNPYYISGDTITIYLSSSILNPTSVTVIPRADCSIEDENGNKAILGPGTVLSVTE